MTITFETKQSVQHQKKKQNLISLQPMPKKDPHDWSGDPVLLDIFGKKIRDKYYLIRSVRVPKWMYDWLENLKIIFNNERAKAIYIRQAIYDKPFYNTVIKKLLKNEPLTPSENKFVERILQEPYF